MTQVALARNDDLDRLERLVADGHAERGIEQDTAARRDALAPLLAGSPHGAAYLIGPKRAPVGYVVVSFGWSVAVGGIEGRVDEIWIRPAVRGRGIGSQVMMALPKALAGAGLKVLHVEVARDDAGARRFCQRLRFEPREDRMAMSRRL